jgi:addiction module RelB/DinJ family antitoxin
MGTGTNTIVAARVPEEIKEQGNAILAGMGLTPTQVINSVYRYVVEYKRLPFEASAPEPGKRALSAVRAEQIADELTALQVCDYDYSHGGTRSFKEALTAAQSAEYEAGHDVGRGAKREAGHETRRGTDNATEHEVPV